MSFKQALKWTGFWWLLAGLFNIYLYFTGGPVPAMAFFTGYIVEQSLSVDNLFVIITIFAFFKIPEKDHSRALFWGLLGAVVMRIAFVFLGISLLARFHWVFYVLGLFLMVTGVKTFLDTPKDMPVEDRKLLKWVQKKFRLNTFVLTIIVIELTDLIFAMDSIPAILGITTDPFIVITSNLFALLSLRSLYFVISHSLTKIRFLHYGLGGILFFVGTKMVMEDFYKISMGTSLTIIVGILLTTILLSFKFNKK